MTGIKLDGAVAVVTGGAGGIGQALSARLTSAGARVAVVDLDRAAAEAAAGAFPGAIGVAADVGDSTAVQGIVDEVVTRLGPIDVYCSNAGIGGGRDLGEEEDWDRSWRVH